MAFRDPSTGRFTTPAGAMGLDPKRYYYDKRQWERLVEKLKARTLKGRREFEYKVGYRAHYAIYVHEDPFAFHPIGKWKYLEDPVRRGRGIMGKIVKQVLKAKRSLEDAALAAVEWLETASKEEVPVDTGFLRNSWFVRLVKG